MIRAINNNKLYSSSTKIILEYLEQYIKKREVMNQSDFKPTFACQYDTNVSVLKSVFSALKSKFTTLNTDFSILNSVFSVLKCNFFPWTDVNICTHSSLNSCPSDKKRCIGAIKASLSAQREASRGLDLFQFVVLANAFQEF